MSDLIGEGMIARRVRIAREDVAWLRFIIEAHDGLANLYVDPDGTISLITPASRAQELDEVLAELTDEIPSLERV